MTKKIIDVPISADGLEITYTALTSTGDMTRFNTVAYSLDELEDAPKRPTIELPLDLIKEMESEKAKATGVYDFLSNIQLSEIGITLDVDVKYSRIGETSNFIAMWYLGYADLVPKKEPEYLIKVTPDSSREYGFVDLDIQGNIIINYFDSLREATMRKFSEEEADKLVAGLTALNARKVKVVVS